MAQNENISLSLANKVDILNKSQSLDARYGVYDTEEDALDAMALYGLDGRQVAVYSDKVNGKVKLYLYNQVEHKLEPIANFEDLTAENTFFNDTTTQLGETNVQTVIETIVRRGILKLEENLVFTVGEDKQFTSIKDAVDKALEYSPNQIYTVTILIDDGFEITEQLMWVNTDLSHIVIEVVDSGDLIFSIDDPNAAALEFIGCWMPLIRNFKLKVSEDNVNVPNTGIRCQVSYAINIDNFEISGFINNLLLLQCFSVLLQNPRIVVSAVNNTRGFNIQGSMVRILNPSFHSLNTSNVNLARHNAIYANNGSVISLGSTSPLPAELGFYGNFRHLFELSNATVFTTTANLNFGTPYNYHYLLSRDSRLSDLTSASVTSNIPANIQTKDGIFIKTNAIIPYNFDGTDYILDYIKAPSGQEYIVTVDDTGKLKSEAVKNINLFIQYTESSVLGDSGTNLIQPDLGLPILEVDDLQTGSSYSGELVLNIENNSIATAKAIELFGAEVYNNTNPSATITTKITFALDFFNQVGDDVDYKLSWEYLSSGEILFGEHTGTIDNTSDLDFELIVTGHSTDNFNLKKARLWRN